MLIYQLNSANKYSAQIIIGDAILQQFFAEMSYNGNGVGSNNTLSLTATPYSLPTAYVGSVVYPAYINIPDNSTSAANSSDVTDPINDDVTTPKYTTVQKVEMYGAGAIGLVFVVILILMIVVCCTTGVSTLATTDKVTDKGLYGSMRADDDNAETALYLDDRNTMIRTAREKSTYY